MDEAQRLNELLLRELPAAGRSLSRVGQRAVFPRGIPYQTAAAKNSEINATIGQVTVGRGDPLPLPAMANATAGLDPRMAFLYSPQEGHAALRHAWAARQRSQSGRCLVPTALPMVAHGHTQAISLVAELFGDEDTTVIAPDPCWENYQLIFTLRPGAKYTSYPFFRDGRFNVEGFTDALARTRGKVVAIVNFPANPAGYTPTPAEVAQLVDALCSHPGPLVVLFDDAYQGMVWEDGLMARSPFWDVLERHDPERCFPMKTDGATKELLFFGGRIGFLTSSATGACEEALLSKLKCIARSTSGVESGPSQAMVLKALQDPGLEGALSERMNVLRQRYHLLKRELAGLRTDRLIPYPFNSGVFGLIGLPSDIDAEAFRQKLLTDQSVGVISMPSVNAIRVAYCSVEDALIPELVRRIERAVL
jgi:aspartate/methionine/tyrosine aminotransferase